MPARTENQARRILVVDDDPTAVKVVRHALEHEGYNVEVAENGQAALSKMDSWHPELVLLDVNMPGLNGLETLERLRQQKEYVSVIFVSGKSETRDIIRGLDRGADDYVCKPFDVYELLARVRAQLRIKHLQDELSEANRRLQEMVNIDDLTGLYNMRSLYENLDNEIYRASRHDRCLAVMMMDMDNFKNVNDENDHLFGSFVLSEVGDIIRSSIRKTDFGARYGGDEFLIVLTETELRGAKTFAERLRKKIEDYCFKKDDFSIKLTVSIGFALLHPGKLSVDAREAVRYADRALYEAKAAGKNCVHFSNLDSKENLKDAAKTLKQA